jgi:TolB-like protein
MSTEDQDPDPLPTLLTELRRRRVFRVAFAYSVVAWVLMQAGEIVFPAFELPNSALRALILALASGLPVVILLAWVLDVTPSGIRLNTRLKRRGPGDAEDAPRDPGSERLGKSLEMLLLGVFVPVFAFGVLIAVLQFGGGDGGGDPPAATALSAGPSIAVLPLEDLSMKGEDDSFFARGMHEDILTQLTRVKELKVISRNSVLPYANGTANIRVIGRELGVGHVLEGSVRRTESQVRVSARLTRVTNEEQLWAQNFDANLENVFEVQSRIATAIASALEAQLVEPPQADASQATPTVVPAAYDAYLKARDLHRNLDAADRSALSRARHLYELALQNDETLAAAWLQLGILHAQAYWFGFDRSEERPERSRRALERARELGIDADQLALAEGILAYYVESDFGRALLQFTEAARRAPGNAEAHFYRAMILRRAGQLEQARLAQAKALELDPLNFGYREEYALTLALAGDLEGARKENVDLLRREPTRLRARFQKWQLDLELDGNPSALLEEILETPRELWREQHYGLLEIVAVLARQPEVAIRIFDERPRANPESGYRDYRIAVLEKFAGNDERHRARLDSASDKFEETVRRFGDGMPDADRRRIEAMFAAQRGEFDRALELQRRNVEATPIENDLIVGSPELWLLLQFELAGGVSEPAINSLERLRSKVAIGGILYGGHYVLAEWPEFEGARNDPRIRRELDAIRPDYARTWVERSETPE